MKLMIGTTERREGWLTLDAVGGDFRATIPPLPDAVKAHIWDEIEWIHGITSLYPWEAEQALREIRSILAVGGKLVLEQPDFNIAKECGVESLFGDPSLRQPLHMNRWAWSPETLTDALKRAGFETINVLPARYHRPERDFRIEAFA